ncbi:hypothetical protein HJFPF1_07393 [Paramyrothecium foliicola]|nr:hypothetical protein HJFPF1_07393 [Paramyrothecium foliicola]
MLVKTIVASLVAVAAFSEAKTTDSPSDTSTKKQDAPTPKVTRPARSIEDTATTLIPKTKSAKKEHTTTSLNAAASTGSSDPAGSGLDSLGLGGLGAGTPPSDPLGLGGLGLGTPSADPLGLGGLGLGTPPADPLGLGGLGLGTPPADPLGLGGLGLGTPPADPLGLGGLGLGTPPADPLGLGGLGLGARDEPATSGDLETLLLEILKGLADALPTGIADTGLPRRAATDLVASIDDLADHTSKIKQRYATAEIAEGSPDKFLPDLQELIENIGSVLTGVDLDDFGNNKLPKADQSKVCDALFSLIQVVRDLVDTFIGKEGIFSNSILLSPVVAILRSITDGVETFAQGIIEVVPTCKKESAAELDKLIDVFGQTRPNEIIP